MTTDHKDEVIKEKRYRIQLLDALTGSRILHALLAGMAKVQQTDKDSEESDAFRNLTAEEKGDAAVQAMWIFAGNDLSREKYEEFQKACLQCCSVYPNEDAAPMPILMANGRWADRELSHDIATVGELIVKVLQFNFSPFFTESASKQPAGPAVAPTRPHHVPPSIASRSAR